MQNTHDVESEAVLRCLSQLSATQDFAPTNIFPVEPEHEGRQRHRKEPKHTAHRNCRTDKARYIEKLRKLGVYVPTHTIPSLCQCAKKQSEKQYASKSSSHIGLANKSR